MTADIKTVLTDEQIAQMARSNEVYSDYHGENVLDEQAFARDIERAVLAASDERKDAEIGRLRHAILKMLEQPKETMSDGKALAAMVKIGKAAIAAGKAGEVKS